MAAVDQSPYLHRSRDGRLLLAAQVCDALGNGLSSVALPWIVLDGGGSATLAGFVFTAGLIPYVAFGLFAGVVGDRYSRKRVMIAGHSLQLVFAALVPLWDIHGPVPAAVVLVAAFVIGIGRTFADAAAFGAIASIVGPKQFVRGQAALSTAWAAGLLLGPFIGGSLIHVVGAAPSVAVEAAGFAIAVGLVLAIERPLAAPQQEVVVGVRESAAEGLRVIRHTPVIRLLTIIAAVWNLSIVGADALIVPLLRRVLELSSGQAGLILGAGGAIGLIAGPALSALADRLDPLRLIAGAILLSGIGSVGLGLAPGFWGALPAFVAFALSGWIATTSMIGERQRHAPERLQARVGISGRMIAITSIAVGSVIASGLAEFVPLRDLYVAFGVVTLALGLVATPALRRVPRAQPQTA